jgi:hypothetical protein
MFRNWVFQNFPFLEDDFDALTDYELFCKICGYVIEYSKDNEEMKAKIEDFQHYFDNLDVQEEINNKLDEMAESGQLDDIIAQYLQLAGVLAYNTLNDLKNADNIVNGSITRTLGLNEYEDGKGSFYKIRTITSGDVVDEVNIVSLNISETLIAEKIPNINDKEIEDLKLNSLSDTVQARIYKELTGLFDYSIGWSLSSCIIVGNRGIAAANDWTENGSAGTKFNIVTFDYKNETISNINLRHQLVSGHSNSMCQLDNDNVLIAGLEHSYIYNLTSNTYEETNLINNLSACSNYGNDIYASAQYYNKFYKLLFNNNTLSIIEEYTIDGLYKSLNDGSQGMVIYDDKIFFMSYAPICLVIYDLKTKKLIKNQLFTSPYICEFEDGFVYDNEILLCDTKGRLFKVDIYGKHNIGGYNNDIITKSLTDILLFNTPTRLEFNQDNTFTFEDIMGFLNSNINDDIGTLGSQLESLTIYLGYGSAGSNNCHQLESIDMLCFKTLKNSGLKNNNNNDVLWYVKNWSANYYDVYDNEIEKYTVFGQLNYSGGDSIPSIIINPNKNVIHENLTQETKNVIDGSVSLINLYLLKIVGHRKVGKGY